MLKLETLQWFQLLLASTYSGAFHPTAEGHAAIADAVAEKARTVLTKYGQASDREVEVEDDVPPPPAEEPWVPEPDLSAIPGSGVAASDGASNPNPPKPEYDEPAKPASPQAAPERVVRAGGPPSRHRRPTISAQPPTLLRIRAVSPEVTPEVLETAPEPELLGEPSLDVPQGSTGGVLGPAVGAPDPGISVEELGAPDAPQPEPRSSWSLLGC